MSSNIIGEPFQLFLGSTHSQQTGGGYGALFCTHNGDLPGYATVTAQGDGVHVWDLQNLHAVASYSVANYVAFAAPAFSLCVTEDGNRSIISYAILGRAPGYQKYRRRTIWVMRQNLSGSTVTTTDKFDVVVNHRLVKICGTGHATVPLLLISENASLSLANTRVEIKSQLDWPGERTHLETFLFSRDSCSFVQVDAAPYSGVAVICCQTGTTLHLRLVLLGTDIVPIGICEIPIASSTSDGEVVLLGLTCSPSGIFSFIDPRGIWTTYQLTVLNSSLVSTPVSENLCLQRFSVLKSKRPPSAADGLSIVSLGTSLVLLAALVEGTQDVSLQIWDLSYGVLLTTQSMPVPSASTLVHICLTIADAGHVLLTFSSTSDTKDDPMRSSIYVVPMDAQLKSSLASALGKTALTAQWLVPGTANGQKTEEESPEIISEVRKYLKKGNAQQAEQAFLKWIDSNSVTLGHEFVKKIFNILLPQDPSPGYPYTPRITRCLLEKAVVSTIMLNGHLITALRQRGDWENVMFALTTVTDISEDELMASAKFLIDRQRRNENAMDVDTSEGYIPPLWTYIFACVSYAFSAVPMRLAIRKHLPDAQDLVLVLEILEVWIQGGTEHEMEALLRSVAVNATIASSDADSPPYPKIILFLRALLDASFVTLLQYPPSYDLLRRILSYLEPEIKLIDRLEPLRGSLEPFAKAQRLKENTGASTEGAVERKKRKKELVQQDSLNIGLYRLEELVL